MLQQNDGKSSFHYELCYFYSEQVSLSMSGTGEECIFY